MYGVKIDELCNPQVKLMNHLIIICKKYLYSSRCNNAKPCFKDFISNVLSIKEIEHVIARKKHKLNIHVEKWKLLL